MRRRCRTRSSSADVAAILLSDGFGGRTADVGRCGRTSPKLTDYELASRLSYFLWSSMPDAELLAHAAAGDLHRAGSSDWRKRGGCCATTAFAAWRSSSAATGSISAVSSSTTASIASAFPTFTNELRQAMFEEPVRFFVDVVQNDRSVLDFLYARHTFVNPASGRALRHARCIAAR